MCRGGGRGGGFLGSREEKRESRSEAVCDSATDTKSGWLDPAPRVWFPCWLLNEHFGTDKLIPYLYAAAALEDQTLCCLWYKVWLPANDSHSLWPLKALLIDNSRCTTEDQSVASGNWQDPSHQSRLINDSTSRWIGKFNFLRIEFRVRIWWIPLWRMKSKTPLERLYQAYLLQVCGDIHDTRKPAPHKSPASTIKYKTDGHLCTSDELPHKDTTAKR